MTFRSSGLAIRFVLPLALVLGLCAYAVVPLVDNLTLRWFVKDLDIRSRLVSEALQDPLQEHVKTRARRRVMDLLNRTATDERLFALAVCAPEGNVLYKTSAWPESLGCAPPSGKTEGIPQLVTLAQGPVHVVQSPLVTSEGENLGKLVVVHDMSFVQRRSKDTRNYVIALFAALAVIISLITVFIAWLSWRGWIQAARSLLRGQLFGAAPAVSMPSPAVQPLVSDLRALLRDLSVENRAQAGNRNWTPDTLKQLLHEELAGDEILVVSNREPYIHSRVGDELEVRRPASGLVTAVEPVMRACSGTWIAHGSGTGDADAADRHGRVSVPPADPAYTLRRIWLSKEEEQGYYYGLANEGLWPLCHIAHVRPVFRDTDWQEYVRVNQRFADAVVEEAHTSDPVVLVQDYHFALLPAMVRERLPRATIITFWHIPWPNPESFGICPWREEILKGLLGSTIIGFHTVFHCRNFMETVDRYLEARIETEESTISYGGKLSQVQAYPISIAWPDDNQPSVDHCKKEIRRINNLPPDHLLAVGVDRLDYTKGILERLQAVERMLELHPDLIGRFSLVQIAAPTRSSLDEYQNLEARVRSMAQRINTRFSNGAYQPIILKVEHHEPDQVYRYYRGVDVCMVTSLHDGMNLVAKEFVANRDDERGVLMLSQFAGAAREMHEALIVNPYHIEQGAETLYRALRMPEAEQRERMRSMRAYVRDFNVYRWAGRMLNDAARLRRRERIRERINGHSEPILKRVV